MLDFVQLFVPHSKYFTGHETGGQTADCVCKMSAKIENGHTPF
jgi:hypothetical protein